MGFNGKHNNADGRDPNFGAIFMSNSGTKRECFKRRLLGLPSSDIQFVEQVKAGMILFLFEYEKRQLHGVFQASCDGAMNIVPNAFTSSGEQFPAQVKFNLIWHCKPLPESLFRDAIRENYFSANKFNFGLSEKQVYKLLCLFSMRKLELEVPRPTISRGYSKSPSDKIRFDGHDSLSASDRLMNEGLRKNGQRAVFSADSPGLHHSNVNPSEDLRNNGQRMVFSADSPGLHHSNVNPSDFYSEPFLECNYLDRNQIRPTSSMIHPMQAQILNNYCATQGDASSKNGLLYDPDAPGLNFSKSSFVRINNGSRSELGSASPSNNCRWYSLSNQPCPMQTELQDMKFPNRGPYGSNRDCIPFNEAWNSDQLAAESVAYGAGNGIRSLKSSSARLPSPDIGGRVHEPFSSFFHNYKSCVDNDTHPIALRQNLGHEMTLQKNNETFSPDIGGRVREPFSSLFHNYKSYVDDDAHPVALRQNLSHEMTLQKNNETFAPAVPWANEGHFPVEYHCPSIHEAGNNIPSLKFSSAPVPPPDIGGRVHEPFSSLFHNYKSCVDDDAHPVALRQNLSHEMTLQKNNETFTPAIPWENEGHFPVNYHDPSIHEYDIECYGNPKNNLGYPKKKGSVFSRLSYVQDVSKQENGNNARNEEHDFDNSVDEVMEMVHQSHSQWLTKRKPKPLVKCNKAEILRDKTKISGSSMKSDRFENTLENVSTDLTTASECDTNETVEEICFVDFKRRSKVRKLDEIEIRSSSESEKNENLVPVSQKRRKLIRPNFRKSTTSDDKGIDLGASQNLEGPLSHETHNLKDVSESCCSLVHTGDSIKTDVEVQNSISQKHFADISRSHARGYVSNEGGGKARDGALTTLDCGSERMENTNNQNAFSSASCKDKSHHIKNLESLLSICREHYVGRGVNSEEGMSKDGCSSSTIEVKDGSDCFQKSGNEKAPIETYCRIKEGLGVDSIKSVYKDTGSLPSICQEHQVDKVICAGRGINTEKAMPEDGGSSFTAQV